MKWRASFVLSSFIARTRLIAGYRIRNEKDKRTGVRKNAENGQAESKRLSRQVIGPACGVGANRGQPIWKVHPLRPADSGEAARGRALGSLLSALRGSE